ncbi:MAG TPA: hypothetical protein VGJ26_00595 [Pirellulales bacterium]|jgi:hypothetical protein
MNGFYSTTITRLVTIALLFAACAPAARAADPDVLEGVPTIKAPPADEVKKQAFTWLETRQADEATRAAAEAIWQKGAGPLATAAPLDRLAATFALVEPQAKALVDVCSHPRGKGLLAPQEWLTAADAQPLLKNNMRLFFGRWLSQQRLYDESLEQLKDLQPADVVDPAALLFYQSVAFHRLLNKTDGLKSIDRLLSEVAEGPPRYVTVAGLMREDLKALEDDSLDHISRRMDDVQRRLGLGRAGEKVRKEEDGVVASLDKLIEQMEEEEKKKQEQQKSGSSGGKNQPQQPMGDSRVAGAQGAGDTHKKPIGRGTGWGELPAKQREEALQQVGKDFPSHYRDVIQAYFKKLATEDGGGER